MLSSSVASCVTTAEASVVSCVTTAEASVASCVATAKDRLNPRHGVRAALSYSARALTLFQRYNALALRIKIFAFFTVFALFRQGRTIFGCKGNVKSAFAFKLHLHAVFQRNSALDLIIGNETPFKGMT